MAVRTLGLVVFLALIAFAVAPAPAVGEGKSASRPAEPKKPAAPYLCDHAKPLDAKEEAVAQAEDHTQYRVEFNGIKGDRVPGFLYVPKRKAAANEQLPAILLQYGSGGNKTTNYIVAVGKQFVGRGFTVLTIDSPNCGERRKKDDKLAALKLMGNEQIMHFCGDYSRAIDYLAGRADVDRERLGYVGISWGAITGVTFVAYDARIKAMGCLIGGGNFMGAYNAQTAEKAAREGSTSGDPVFHVARIAPRPLLFINVTKDQLIARPWAESLHKAAGAGSKVIWLETDHYFNGLDRAAVCGRVIDFMDKELAPKRAAGK
jgi:dienelactone hydrolase